MTRSFLNYYKKTHFSLWFLIQKSIYLRSLFPSFYSINFTSYKITYGAKVLACSFFSSSETTSESQKQLVTFRIFRSFRIWVQKFCQFLLGNNEGILERQFRQKCFSYIFTIRIRKQTLKLLLIYQLVGVKFTLQNALFYFHFVFEKST